MAIVCRAAFLVLLAVYGAYAACRQETISSNDYEYKRVTIQGALLVTSVTVVTRQSTSPCVLNDSYGSIGPDVFVDRGCSAVFRVCYQTGNTVLIGCDSNNFQQRSCDAGAPIQQLTLSRQKSRSPCIDGYSYYKSGRNIVVNKGCAADFLVGY